MSTPKEAKAKPRRRRWLRRTAQGVGWLLVVLVALVVVVVHSLDRPWVKGRLQHLVAAASGLEFDYAATRVRLFSGLEVDGVVVASPPAFRGWSPSLMRVGKVEVGWSWRSLARARVLNVRLVDVDVTLVDDKALGWSAAPKPVAAPRPATAEAGPMVPLSRRLHELLLAAPPLTELAVERLGVTVLRTGPVASRWALSGLGIAAEVAEVPGGWRVALRLGSEPTPLTLTLGSTYGDASARLWLAADLAPSGATVRVGLGELKQPWNDRLPSQALTLELATWFEPAAHRVRLQLGKLDVLDGTARATAEVSLFDSDDGGVFVTEASADADLGRALGLVTALGLPVELHRGQLHAKVSHLGLGVPSAGLEEATAKVEVALDGLQLHQPKATIASARLDLTVAPPTVKPHQGDKGLRRAAAALLDTLRTRGTLVLRGVHGQLGPRTVVSDELSLDLDGKLVSGSEWSGAIGARLPSLMLSGPDRVVGKDLVLAVEVGRLHRDRSAYFGLRGQVGIKLKTPSLKLALAGLGVAVGEAAISLKAPLASTPLSAELDLQLGALAVDRDGHRLLDGPAHLSVGLTEVVPQPTDWGRSRAVAAVELTAARTHTVLHAHKLADALDYDVTVDATSLSALRPVLPAHPRWDAPFDQMAMSLHSKGRVEHLQHPALAHQTEVRLVRPALTGARTLAADQLTLTLHSTGDTLRHRADGTLDTKGLVAGHIRVGDGNLDFSVNLDAPAATALLHLGARGPAAPKLGLDARLAFDRQRRALDFDVDGQLGKLEPLSALFDNVPVVRDFDLESLALGLSAKGSLVGVVDSVDGQGRPKLATDPSATLGGHAVVRLSAQELSWSVAEHALYTPSLTWRGELRTDGGRRSLDGELGLDRLSVATGAHELEIRHIRDQVVLGLTGPLSTGEVTLHNALHADTVSQDYQPHYRIGDLSLGLDAKRDRDGVIRVSELVLRNVAGGTSLRSSGAVEILGERRSLAINTALEQDLSRLSNSTQLFAGHGKVALALRLGSGNLRVFRARGNLSVSDGGFTMPQLGVLAETIAADIPFAADVSFSDGGVTFVRDLDVNPYSERRFADQHPLLGRHSYLSIAKLVTPLFSAAPLAGNLQIEQNIFQLNQLDMGVRHGRITGQCVLDWSRDDPTLQLHVRASHVMSSHDEPFDGNAAVVISARRRSIDGRAEILRIGRRHLLDLLDVADPHHTEAPINRIRRTLALGYPDRLRLTFERGFASARVTFAGLASLVSLDEIRGIPMGPLVDKLLAPLDDAEEGE